MRRIKPFCIKLTKDITLEDLKEMEYKLIRAGVHIYEGVCTEHMSSYSYYGVDYDEDATFRDYTEDYDRDGDTKVITLNEVDKHLGFAQKPPKQLSKEDHVKALEDMGYSVNLTGGTKVAVGQTWKRLDGHIITVDAVIKDKAVVHYYIGETLKARTNLVSYIEKDCTFAEEV